MVEYERRGLICLHLEAQAGARERSPAPKAVTATGIGDALEVGDAVARRVRLLDELATLRDEGLVSADQRHVDGHDAPRTVYFLTGEGREYATRIREELRAESVVVTDDGDEEIPLAEVDRYVDGPTPMVTALARLTDDGRVPLERTAGNRFVDRKAALATVREAIEGSITRQSQTVVVSGAAGIGKTALVDEAVDRIAANREDFVVARGVCSAGPTAPYGPLRQAFGNIPGGDVLLARLEEARTRVTPNEPAQVDARRTVLFDAVADDLRAVAADRPVVVFLDTFQWADEATLALFAHLATAITEWLYPVAFVGTVRSPAVSTGDDTLTSILERLERDAAYREVTLDPLARDDTRALVASAIGREPLPEPFVDLVHERTGGVPLFVRETMAHMLEREVVDPECGRYPTRAEEVTLPEAVTEQVEQRLAALDEPSRTLVELGAVVGEYIPGEVLAAASDLPPATHREYVDALVSSRIWARGGEDGAVGGGKAVGSGEVPSGEGIEDADGHQAWASDGDLRFISGSVREAVVDGILEETARGYHERVGEAFVDVSDDVQEHTARIAHHFEQAGAEDRALSYYRQAGTYAEETYAHEEAVANYERALTLATGPDGTDEVAVASITGDVADVYETKGELDSALETAREGLARAPDGSRARCRLLGVAAEVHAARAEFDEARETARRQRDLAADLGAWDLRAAAIHRLGAVAMEQGRYDQARDHLRRSLELFRDVDDRQGEADALEALGAVARNRGEYGRARVHIQQSLAIARELDDRRGVASRLKRLGTVTYYQGDYHEAREYYDRSLAIARELGDPQGEADALNNLGLVAHEVGDYDEAEAYYERSLEIERELGNRQGVANSLNNLGLVAQLRSEYDQALEYHQRSLEIERELGDRQGEANSLNNLGVVAQQRGEWDRAQKCHERSLDIARELADRQRESYSLGNLGLVAERRGAYDRARTYFEETLDVKREIGDKKGEATRLNNRGFVDLRQAEYDRARETFDRSLDIARDLGERRETSQSLDYLGAVARLQGEYERAREYHERSLDIARELGDRRREVENRNNLGRVALREGDAHRASESFERGLEIARELDTPRREANSLAGLGATALRRGDLAAAEKRLEAAQETFESVGDPFGVAVVQLRTARLALERDGVETALEGARSARESFSDLGATHWVGRSQQLLGCVAVASGAPTVARERWRAALETFETLGAPQDALAALEALIVASRERGDDARVREWCERAADLVADAPRPVAERHRRWVDRVQME